MTENLHTDCVQSRQAGFVRCCPKETVHTFTLKKGITTLCQIKSKS
ncbi:hypothetical protein RUMCAL_02441 [Ruminococcus callidus ATCC 27760]|uniref:Uncharacterized protein n=1 Tax=Ruminococcus callidus ATCC 27760 TaxID=411473 RepID=U2LRZ6_9FIRM|nr:hypothetical protein RUMCAL_02441 [Ruminococcus callidus ATCC 27760]